MDGKPARSERLVVAGIGRAASFRGLGAQEGQAPRFDPGKWTMDGCRLLGATSKVRHVVGPCETCGL